MATVISSPSLSAIVESPLSSAALTPKLSLKVTPKKRSTTTKTSKKSKLKDTPVDKPKQTKSRNGKSQTSTFFLSQPKLPVVGHATDTLLRLQKLQREAIEVR